MIARIEKKSTFDDAVSVFTIVGATEEGIDNQVYELQQHSRSITSAAYPADKFRVLTYNIHDNEQPEKEL